MVPAAMKNEPQTSRCLLCNAETSDVGVIHHPRPAKVAGVPIDLGATRYGMQQCSECGFAFKCPRIPEDLLLACYREAPSGQWGKDVDPIERAYDTLATLINAHRTGSRILDVGCFTGTLLAYLGDDWDKFGVEPAKDASLLAQERQVTVLGATVESLPTETEPFDTILSIDVLEHLAHPMEHLRAIARHLKPGGCFIAVTGDTSTWPWRMQGSRHWYAALPEHVSFYNPICIQQALKPHALELMERVVFRHTRMPLASIIGQNLKNIAYAAGVTIHNAIPNRITEIAARRSAPVWIASRDHMALVLRKTPDL